MADKEQQIMDNCRKLMSILNPEEKERFLTFTEGMAFLAEQRMLKRAAERSSTRAILNP